MADIGNVSVTLKLRLFVSVNDAPAVRLDWFLMARLRLVALIAKVLRVPLKSEISA